MILASQKYYDFPNEIMDKNVFAWLAIKCYMLTLNESDQKYKQKEFYAKVSVSMSTINGSRRLIPFTPIVHIFVSDYFGFCRIRLISWIRIRIRSDYRSKSESESETENVCQIRPESESDRIRIGSDSDCRIRRAALSSCHVVIRIQHVNHMKNSSRLIRWDQRQHQR